MRSRRYFRLIAGLLLVLLVAVLGFQLLTGATRFVISSGASMEPTIESGDLIIIRKADSYAIGDVAAYRSDDLGTVLHRIIDIRDDVGGTRYILQGDNNDFIDSDEPFAEGILGRAVSVVPNGGRLLGLLPIVVAALFAGYWIYTSDERPRGARRSGPAIDVRPREAAGWSIATVAAGLAFIAVFTPTTTSEESEIEHRSALELDWSADVAASPVYPDGEIDRNDPIFLSEIDRVSLAATVQLDPNLVGPRSDLELVAVVSDDSGWNRTIPLPTEPSDGANRTELVGSLDLVELRSLLDGVAERTGFRAARHDVTVTVEARFIGELAGQPVDETLELAVPATLDPLMLTTAPTTAWTATTSGVVTIDEFTTATFGAAGLEMPIETLRFVAPMLVMIGLALALWPRRPESEADVVERSLGGLTLVVDSLEVPAEATLIDVESAGDLRQVAELDGSPILHPTDEPPRWYCAAFGVWYRLTVDVSEEADHAGPLDEGHAVETPVGDPIVASVLPTRSPSPAVPAPAIPSAVASSVAQAPASPASHAPVTWPEPGEMAQDAAAWVSGTDAD